MKKERKGSRAAIIVLAVLVVLAAIGGGAWFLLSEYAFVSGSLVDRDSASLALPDGELPDAHALSRLTALRTLDLRGRTDVTNAYVDEAAAALPAGCAVLWSIELTDGTVSSDSTALTLPNCTEADAAKLAYFPNLMRVDASGSTAYAALYAAAQDLPGVAVTYTLPVGDAVLTNTATVLAAANVSDVSALPDALPYFPLLAEADLRGGTVPDADMRALREAFPSIRFRWSVHLFGKAYDSDAAEIDLTGVTFADEQEAIDALSCFTSLTGVDLRGTGLSTAQARAVAAAMQPIPVRYDVAIGQSVFDSAAEELDLRSVQGVDGGSLSDALSDFSGLSVVYLPDGLLDDAAVAALEAAYPDTLIARQIELFGTIVSTADAEVDFSGAKIDDPAALEAALALLPRLEKCVVCDCGLSNEQMEALCEAYPSIRFVWTIELGPHKLRTDATGFSTKNPSKYTSPKASDEYNQRVRTTKRLKAGDIEALRYCTDLVALDLGHNYLTNDDLAVIGTLEHLQILILADNKITDISALANLRELQYIELFMNKIPDMSPLAGLTNLVDVNVCNTGLSDLTPFYQLTGLKRLWYGMNPCDREEQKKLAEALQDCECNYTTSDETGEGWREDPRYQWMRSFFG